MKKTLALVLAAVMTAGMTSVAFAAAKSDEVFVGLSTDGSTEWNKVYKLNSDGVADEVLGSELLEGGDEIAIPISYFVDKNENGAYDSDEFDWYTNGADYDKSVSIYDDWKIGDADVELRYVKYTVENEFVVGQTPRIYSVVVTIPDNNSNKVEDLSGTISVGRTRTKAKDSAHSVEVELSYAPAGEAVVVDFDGGNVDGIIKFASDCGEIDIEFGEEALFTVDASGQGKLNLAWNTTFDKEIADRDKSANMDFITFEGTPSFNKTGTFYLYADDDTGFVYEVVDGQVKALDAEYNEDYEAWEFKTRTLTEYILSDKELDLDAVNTVEDDTDSSSSTTDGGKENPDTGR